MKAPLQLTTHGRLRAARWSLVRPASGYPQRISWSPAAAHDPAAAYAAGAMPMRVFASNRAFINTLEQYALLLTTSATLVRSAVLLLCVHMLTMARNAPLFFVDRVRDTAARDCALSDQLCEGPRTHTPTLI